MEFSAVKQLQDSWQRLEAILIRRENVIRFLIGRALVMLAMVIGFWLTMRHSI